MLDNLSIEALKARADELGVDYADSIGVKKLAERIAAKKKELGIEETNETTETKDSTVEQTSTTQETKTEETDTEKVVYIPQFGLMHNGKSYPAEIALPDGVMSEVHAEPLIAQGVLKIGNAK